MTRTSPEVGVPDHERCRGHRNLIARAWSSSWRLLTAIISLVILIRISALMTGLAAAIMPQLRLVLRNAFKTIRPIFRAIQNQREVTAG